jgi:hypothetical protein
MVPTVQSNLGIVLSALGEHAAAAELFASALRTVQDTGNVEVMVSTIEGFGQIAFARGDWARAVHLAAAADKLRSTLGAPRLLKDQREFEAERAAESAEIGQAIYARHWEEGAALNQEQAIALALALVDPAR